MKNNSKVAIAIFWFECINPNLKDNWCFSDSHYFPKYLKLVEMAIIHVLGSVEDEKCLSLAFLKSKLQAALDPHLPFVIGMYSQKFILF